MYLRTRINIICMTGMHVCQKWLKNDIDVVATQHKQSIGASEFNIIGYVRN